MSFQNLVTHNVDGCMTFTIDQEICHPAPSQNSPPILLDFVWVGDTKLAKNVPKGLYYGVNTFLGQQGRLD